MEVPLTKSAKKSCALLYKAYTKRIGNGTPKTMARMFEKNVVENAELFSLISEDIAELKEVKFITADILGSLTITDNCIVYMENLSAETVKDWLSFFSQFIP